MLVRCLSAKQWKKTGYLIEKNTTFVAECDGSWKNNTLIILNV